MTKRSKKQCPFGKVPYPTKAAAEKAAAGGRAKRCGKVDDGGWFTLPGVAATEVAA